jgi:hypothetical protein
MDKIDLKDAKCHKLSFDSAVNFLRGAETKDLTGFDIEAYTGAVVERWWGKLVVAVDGIQAAQQMPIFRDHNMSEIVGYSTKSSKDGSFSVSGVFSSATKAAQEVKALAAEGFPWQASIGVKPKIVVDLRENASMEVNGQEVMGPAEVWLESEVFETSFVPLGADSNTRVTVFERENADGTAATRAIPPNIETKVKSMDLDKLKSEFPDLVAAIAKEATADQETKLAQARQEGAEAERGRIQEVRLQLVPGHEALIEELAFDGKTTGPEAAVKVIAAEKLVRTVTLENFKKSAPEVLKQDSTDNSAPADPIAAKWAKMSADEKGEFIDFENFKAYVAEDGATRIKGGKR